MAGRGGAGGVGGFAGTGASGNGGVSGAAGMRGGAGFSGGAGTGSGGTSGGTGGVSGGTGGTSGGNPETGRLAGITAAHNAVRAMVQTQTPLPPLTWSPMIAAYAQQWADMLAQTCSPMHRPSSQLQQVGYGENLAVFGSSQTPASTATQAVNGWAGEVSCWTFGAFMKTDMCNMACYQRMNSDGCGHYTQIVWRTSTQLGCGVATCANKNQDIWICNYSPAGNIINRNPY